MTLMTSAAALAVVWPLLRPAVPFRSGSDLAVYRDQLDELERDGRSGLIGNAEAEAARVEIARRLIAAADAAAEAPKGKSSVWGRRAAIFAALVALPIGAISLYLSIGSPSLPTHPSAAPTAPPSMERATNSLLIKLETDLKRDPGNGERWENIGRAYMEAERFDDAAIAWRNALRILGDRAERQSDLGQSIMAAANGLVTDDARAAFERAVALDPDIMIARFFLGMAAEQSGRREEAAQIWRDMIAAAPVGAPWLTLVRESLMRVETGLKP
jgi:cytochrome c-type biogenesis protein CcmH